MNRKILYYILLISFTVLSCKSTQVTPTGNTDNKSAYNFSSLYNPGESLLDPECQIYIKDDNIATFYFKFDTENIRIISDDRESDIEMSVKYILRDMETQEVADSSTVSFNFDMKNNNYFVFDSLNIRMPENKNYRLIANFLGIPQVKPKIILLNIDNKNKYSPDKFSLQKADSTNQFIFRNFVNKDNIYRIVSNEFNSMPVNIEFYSPSEFSIIPPYNANFIDNRIFIPDSIFRYQIGDTLSFKKKGFYILKPDSSSDKYLCILNYGHDFPNITTVGDMVEPIKLIATSKEYNKIKESEDVKQAIDEYWLSRSSNQRFAKEQIRVFYNRVQLANLYFSDNIEGWKTDRGNIYVVFGAPSVINISDNREEWFYGENPDVAGLLFVFNKTDNPFSNNTYIMERDVLYQPTWGQALSTWRKGRVFSISK